MWRSRYLTHRIITRLCSLFIIYLHFDLCIRKWALLQWELLLKLIYTFVEKCGKINSNSSCRFFTFISNNEERIKTLYMLLLVLFFIRKCCYWYRNTCLCTFLMFHSIQLFHFKLILMMFMKFNYCVSKSFWFYRGILLWRIAILLRLWIECGRLLGFLMRTY